MRIRQIESFLAVARFLNFTKAAEHLHVCQPTLSKQIAELEGQLGVQLFLRDNRSVRLSPSGEVFVEEGKAVLAKLNEAVERTRNVGSGKMGNLNIGSVDLNNNYVSQVVKRFRSCFPNIGLNLYKYAYGTLYEALINQKVDIGVCNAIEVEDCPELTWKVFDKNPLCVLMSIDHPLANEREIEIEALAHEPFVFSHIPGTEKVLKICQEIGFTPRVVSYVSQPFSFDTLVLQVQSGVGVTLTTRNAVGDDPPGLRLVRIKGINKKGYAVLAWRKENLNSSIPLFVESVFNHNSLQPAG